MTALRVTLVAGIDPARTRPGGIRSYVLGLGRYLASAGVDVTLMGIGGPARDEPFKFVATAPNPSTSSFAFHGSLRRSLRRHHISGGIVHAQRPDDLVPFLADTSRPRLIATIHGDPLPGIRHRHGRLGSYVYRRWERKSVGAADRLLFVDRQSRDAFSRRYPEHATKFIDGLVGIDLETFQPRARGEAQRLWKLEDRTHVLFAGRFEHEKNLPFLARALSLCETHPTLLLAGAGSADVTLPALLDGVPHRFLGVVPHEQMAYLFSAVEATLIPSTREAMPLACLESLACGVPVVATRTGRIPEIIMSGTNGFVVDFKPDEFAQAIDQAVRSSRGMRDRCRASAEEFGWDRVGPTLIRLYQEVLE